jgi:ATP-dependent DNA helicase RecG
LSSIVQSKAWVNRARALLDSSLQPPRHELNELDWKTGVSPDKRRMSEHLCAFANYPGGGFLVFGVSSSGSIDGIETPKIEAAMTHLTNLSRDAVEPPLQLDHLAVDAEDSNVLLVHIPESDVKPVRLRGQPIEKSFIRSGATTRPASRQEIGTMMLHSRTPRWEDMHVSTLWTDEQLLASLSIEPIHKLLNQPSPSSSSAALDWMDAEGFIKRHPSGGGYVTNLGAISAANPLASFPELARKAARVIVYRGVNKANALQETEGGYGYALSFQRLLGFVMSKLPQHEVIEHAIRQTRTLYPELALREIIANALIHQDFTIGGAGPLIEIFDDRIEISSPGSLLPSKRLEELIGTQPESRNEKLARAFRRYRICEERGSGLLKAGEAIESQGLPPISFEQGPNHFKVSLFALRTFAQMSGAERLNACYQHALLKYRSNTAMTNKSLRERLQMSEKQRSMVSVLIQEAVDRKLIVSADPDSKSRKFAEYVPAWTRGV